MRLVIFGGEALNFQSIRPWLERHGDQHPRLVNMYGITETTAHVTYRPVKMADLDVKGSMIGCPIPDLNIYILDEYMQHVPVGIEGEMYIGGAGLSRGYLNRPELTALKFIQNPFDADPNERLYKTGDLARYLPNDDIECLGRLDHQVKIRGFRVEIGEIESVLRQHPVIWEVTVMLREDVPDDKRLVAYLVPGEGRLPMVGELRDFLKEKLPEYMVPSIFVELDALPLTPNGKVDRRALSKPDRSRANLAEAYLAPRTPIERKIAGIWGQVLDLEQVGVHDNLFELGGHSLLAAQLVSRVFSMFQVEVSLRSFFRKPTVAEMSANILQLLLDDAKREDIKHILAKLESISDAEAQELLDGIEEYGKNGREY